jgi:hypothetical protein
MRKSRRTLAGLSNWYRFSGGVACGMLQLPNHQAVDKQASATVF